MYLTGTLTQLVIRVTSTGRFTGTAFAAALLTRLVIGAVVGALLIVIWPPVIPAVQLLPRATVLRTARSQNRGGSIV
jgi:hypothetical protein